MKTRNIFIAIIIIIMSLEGNAQSHNEEITVEGTYVPQIKKSERIIKTPELPRKEFDIPAYNVNMDDFFYKYKIESETISPLQYNAVSDVSVVNNFIKAGMGTRLSPDFLFRHYSDLNRKNSLGLGISHNSTWLEMKDYPFLRYMNNDFSISMNNRFSGFQLHSYVDYGYDMYYLNPDPDIMTADGYYSKRNIHALNVKLLANNNETSYKSLYNEYLLDYSYSGIQGGMQENLAKFNAHLEHSNSWFRNSDGVQTLSLDINADIDNINQTLFLIAANPYLAFDGEYYNLHLGFRVDAKTNSTNLGGIYPDIKGSLYLFNRNLEFYAGLDGKTKINTLKEILSENPFIVSDLTNMGEFDYEKTKIDFQGGLKFKVMNKISGHLGLSYKMVDNHIFYVKSEERLNTFDIILNDCNIFNFNIDLHYKLKDDLNLVANFSYHKYDMLYSQSNDSLIDALEEIVNQQAWYKPELEFTLKGIYKLDEQWNFSVATYFEGKRYDLSNYNIVKELKPIVDIQLGCDYNMNENLSFYCEVKNLINDKYQMYYGYQSYGLQAFLGFKYRFL